LPALVRLPLEERFGCSLEHIRVHTDEEAAQAADVLGARAFAFGNHIVLSRGARDWTHDATFEALAHEIAHCLQQRGLRGRVASSIGGLDEQAEKEAEEAVACVKQGRPVKSISPDPSESIRRIVSVKAGSPAIVITQRPAVNQPFLTEVDGLKVMRFSSDPLQFNGQATLEGDNNADSSADWTLGVIQIEWMETNWGYYRGQANNHGSALVRRARRPIEFHHPCRDTITKGAFLIDNRPAPPGAPVAGALYDRYQTVAGQSFPIDMALRFYDAPTASYEPMLRNDRTQQQNFLREVQVEYQFCTILTLLSPTGAFRHLKHFYWNVRWQTRFEPLIAAMPNGPLCPTPVPGGNSAAVSPIYDGRPTDGRFADIITLPTAKNCREEADYTSNNPHIISSAVWENFSVNR
jgi:hypothetical protein